jgi:hypothetical protein
MMNVLFFFNNLLIQQCVENHVHKEQYIIGITKQQLNFPIYDNFFTCIDDYTEEKINHSLWITFINEKKSDNIDYEEWNLIPLNLIYGPLHLRFKGLSYFYKISKRYCRKYLEQVKII